MQEKNKSLVELNIATFLLSINSLFAKLISLPAGLIILGRTIFAAIALFIFICGTKQSFRLNNKKAYGYILLLGILLSIHWVALFYAIQVSTVSIAILAFFVFPIITTFLEPYFFKEKIKLLDVVSAFCVFGGVLLLVPDFSFSNNITLGIFWGLISALAFSFRNILTKKHLSHYSSSVVMFYQVVIVALSLSPLLGFYKVSFQNNDFLYLVILGVIFTAITHSLFVNSLRKLSAKTASIINCLQPFYTIILAFVFLREVPTLKTVIGGIIILGAAVAETIQHHKLK